MDGEVGEVYGLGSLFGCGLAAPADQELAEAPAHEAVIGVKAGEGEAFLRIEGEELREKLGRLGARPGRQAEQVPGTYFRAPTPHRVAEAGVTGIDDA